MDKSELLAKLAEFVARAHYGSDFDDAQVRWMWRRLRPLLAADLQRAQEFASRVQPSTLPFEALHEEAASLERRVDRHDQSFASP